MKILCIFWNNVKAETTIKLVENNKIIDQEIEIAKLFNDFFVNIIKKLEIFTKKKCSTEKLSELEIAIGKYRNHPSINFITKKMEKLWNLTFVYDFTSYKETIIEVKNLKSRKVS